MIGYRSIGEDELNFLIFSNNPIYGRRILCNWTGSGCTEDRFGMVSFYKEPYIWHDANHLFNIKVNLKKDAQEGVATYMASKDFGKTKIWTGREGKTEYKINELYTRCYYPKDIFELDIGNHYTDNYVSNVIIPFCKKNNIFLIRNGQIVFETFK